MKPAESPESFIDWVLLQTLFLVQYHYQESNHAQEQCA